jgi:hypothetical protein
MQTIIYQGRKIGVVQVNWLEGCIATISPVDAENDDYRSGMDVLWRDAQGGYYLQRKLRDEYGSYFGVHRISLRGAILWAIKQHNEADLAFRHDVIKAITATSVSFVKAESGQSRVECPIETDLWAKVKAEAKERRQSPSECIVGLLKEFFAEPPEEEEAPEGEDWQPGEEPKLKLVHRLELELSEEAFALLQTCALWQDFLSPEEFIREMVSKSVYEWTHQLDLLTMGNMFEAPAKEVA